MTPREPCLCGAEDCPRCYPEILYYPDDGTADERKSQLEKPTVDPFVADMETAEKAPL